MYDVVCYFDDIVTTIHCLDYNFVFDKCVTNEIITGNNVIKSYIVPKTSVISILDVNKGLIVYG